jgi:hypothetical protein
VRDGNTSGIAYVQANLSTYSLYTETEKNASDASQYASGVRDGNASGIAYVQANLSTYSLYTETEKNASDAIQYASGVRDGNTSGIAYVQANLSTYRLYTEVEKTEAEVAAKAAGRSEAIAEVQADLAREGLAIITYLEEVEKVQPYTSEWFYQPGVGWLWTSPSTYPYFFLSPEQEGLGKGAWLYYNQQAGKEGPSFYDYATETWVTPRPIEVQSEDKTLP